jgi:hypothetical protein
MAMTERGTDLSRKAINLSVFSRSLQHPAVVYPAALGLLGGLGAALLVSSPMILIGAAAAGGIAVAGLGANYIFRRERFAREYIQAASAQISAERAAMLENLEQDLQEAGRKEAVRQLGRFRDKIETFEQMLSEKLGESELTHARFLGIAEQVYLSGVDNLRGVVYAARGAAAIDAPYIRSRIGSLESGKQAGKDTEIQSLNEQLRLHAEHMARMDAALAQNEQALARLDAAIAAVSQMKTEAGRASVSMETAMQELSRVAQRAREYS